MLCIENYQKSARLKSNAQDRPSSQIQNPKSSKVSVSRSISFLHPLEVLALYQAFYASLHHVEIGFEALCEL
jgi:hypothetical protein